MTETEIDSITEALEKRGVEKDEIEEAILAQQAIAESQAQAKANKIYRKNRRELDRLYKHAQAAVLDNNFPAYKYAIEKSRDILRQPYTDEIILTGWQTSRKIIWDIINDQAGKI